MERTIVRFEVDDQGDPYAVMSCGHTRHVRHEPPLIERPWVTSEQGRAAFVGHTLHCAFCDMPALPADVSAYKQTGSFEETTVPKGLLTQHATKPGVWGRIVVEEGRLLYVIEEGAHAGAWVLRPGVHGIVAPAVRHHVEPRGPVRFHVVFLKAPPAAPRLG